MASADCGASADCVHIQAEREVGARFAGCRESEECGCSRDGRHEAVARLTGCRASADCVHIHAVSEASLPGCELAQMDWTAGHCGSEDRDENSGRDESSDSAYATAHAWQTDAHSHGCWLEEHGCSEGCDWGCVGRCQDARVVEASDLRRRCSQLRFDELKSRWGLRVGLVQTEEKVQPGGEVVSVNGTRVAVKGM